MAEVVLRQLADRQTLDAAAPPAIHFKITAGATEAYRHVVRHDLDGDHCESFGLRGIHFAGHDR
jgi:hypothetical protein